MIASTAFASTKMPDTKQKATIESYHPVTATVVNVLTFSVADYDVAVITPGFDNPIVFVKSYEAINSFAVIFDVGWQSFDTKFIQIPYTEKLHSNYVIDHEKNLQKLEVNLSRNNC